MCFPEVILVRGELCVWLSWAELMCHNQASLVFTSDTTQLQCFFLIWFYFNTLKPRWIHYLTFVYLSLVRKFPDRNSKPLKTFTRGRKGIATAISNFL
jgi:hypothetical protein